MTKDTFTSGFLAVDFISIARSDHVVFISYPCRPLAGGRAVCKMVSPEESYVEGVLKSLSREFYDRLIFAGIIDEKAKLIHFQKGEAAQFLPMDRQNALDVQVSLVFTLAKQFEDFGGPLVHTILTFQDCDVIIMNVLRDSILYVICTSGSSEIAEMLTRLVEDMPRRIDKTYNKGQEFIEDEWSGE